MKKTTSIFVSILSLTLFTLIAACSPQVETAAPPPSAAVFKDTPATATFSDPFAFCAALGRIDAPDNRYTGDPVPDAIIEGFKKAAGLENSTMPADMFIKSTIWRCMENKVYACNFGANLPCASKANTSTNPTQSMNDFCKANPNAEFLPMSETGHDTIYSWHCAGEIAEVVEQISEVDASGYIANIWYSIEPKP